MFPFAAQLCKRSIGSSTTVLIRGILMTVSSVPRNVVVTSVTTVSSNQLFGTKYESRY